MMNLWPPQGFILQTLGRDPPESDAQWRGISSVNAIAGPTQTRIPIAVGIGFGGIRVAVPFLPQSGTRIPTFPSGAPL
jgi:hypothetical protein